jgi:hypothetical protein
VTGRPARESADVWLRSRPASRSPVGEGWLRRVASVAVLRLLGAALLWLPGPSRAQPSALGEAETALQSVQFDRAREAAHRAVDGGGLDTAQLARAYEIIGLCAASVGSHAEAHAAYLRLLALAPGTRPSDMLPPEKNRPFYEAQGFWLARRERLGLALEVEPSTRRVKVQVTDPLGMGEKLVYVEPADAPSRVVHPLPTTGIVELEVGTQPAAVEFVVELIDAQANVLARRTGKLESAAPPVAAQPAALPAPTLVADEEDEPPPSAPPERPRRTLRRSPWLWAAVGVVVAGAATTTAILMRSREPELRTDISLDR